MLIVVFLGGCSKGNDSYIPLNEGIRWEYQITSGSTTAGRAIISNLPQRDLGGKRVTPQKIDFGGLTPIQFLVQDTEGICRFALQGPEDPEPKIKPDLEYLLKKPIKVGTNWKSNTHTILLREKLPFVLTTSIESTDDIVTVPAGTFNNCIKLNSSGIARKNLGVFGVAIVNVQYYEWLAPGVGSIKSILKESCNHLMVGTGDLTLQLESFNK